MNIIYIANTPFINNSYLSFPKITEVLRKRATIRAFIMLLGMHVIQQLSGINIVTFHVEKIFAVVSDNISPGVSSIILGIVQVIREGYYNFLLFIDCNK